MQPSLHASEDPAPPPTDASDVSGLRIEDVVDIAKLQAIQDTFAEAMGVAAVTVDRDGVPVTLESNFQDFCRLIRSTREGLKRCRACDASGGLTAYESGRPSTYVCASGLVDAAAPIIIEGQYLGCILCGQVRMAGDPEAALDEIARRTASLGHDPARVREAALAAPTIPRERFDSAVEMLMLTANHIVEVGMTNLIQKRLLVESAEKAAVETALRDAQLQALQARMNPHFLFNSLTLISYTALEEQAPRTEEIAYALADVLRYSLRNTATTVPLHEEFDMIGRCLSLHHLRFGSQLVTRLDLDPAVRDQPVPCMFLQPLVENAIVHGVESLTRKATVEVTAKARGGRVVIEVFDDGVGMTAEQVRTLNQTRRPLPNPRRNRPALGLQTVLTRLESEYGSTFDFKVTSSAAHGSTLRLSWPLRRATTPRR